ncbi:MAG: glycosyltransferase family 4 protein [Planctomycetes bacterium]|nr:glycosyltransferase family 4 protein [Planctomycetota bacterium]
MRLAIVADTYPPLRISGAVQMRDLVREFVEQGHEPTVIVPNAALEEPWRIERDGNITVLRVRTPRTKDIDYIRRTINEMRLPHVLLRALRQSGLGREGWDGVVWYSPTIFLGPIVKVLRRESRCRSYLILRDIFPEWAVDMGLMRRGLAYRFFKWIERGQYAVADTIGVQTPANMPYLEGWARRTGRRLEVLQNWLRPATNEGCRIDLSQTALVGRKVFVYAGNMGVAQGMDDFVELAERLRAREDVGFLFVGRGSDAARFAAMVESKRLDNVLFHDEIEPKEIPGLLAQCHVGIVALDVRHKSHNIPGKFLTYMQAGIPVLARINPGNDLERLINDERVGRVCTGGDADMLCRLAEDLLSNPAEMEAVRARGRDLSDRLFSSTAAVRQIVKALQPDESVAPRSLRVLMVNQVFWPDVAATAQHGHDLARYLVQRGDSVMALASRSIYGESGVTLPSEDLVDGIRIVRVAHSAFGKRRIAGRVFDFVAFYAAAALKAFRLPRPDAVVCFTTPPFIAVVGLLLKWIRGSRFAFWAMDLYPEVPVAAGLLRRGSLLHRFFAAIESFCMRHADVVIVLGRCMRERVLERGIDPRKVEMIHVWSDPNEVRDLERTSNPLRTEWAIGDRFVVEYSGNFGIGHDNATLFEAMRMLSSEDALRWVVVGGGTKKAELESFVQTQHIQNAVLQPYQPRGRLGELLALGDVHLVTMANEFAGLMVPSKFYGVLAAGRPLIFIGPRTSEVARVVVDEGCGVVVEPGDGRGLSDAVQSLRQDPERARQMGNRGRRVLVERYDTQRACAAWHALLHRIVEVHA